MTKEQGSEPICQSTSEKAVVREDEVKPGTSGGELASEVCTPAEALAPNSSESNLQNTRKEQESKPVPQMTSEKAVVQEDEAKPGPSGGEMASEVCTPVEALAPNSSESDLQNTRKEQELTPVSQLTSEKAVVQEDEAKPGPSGFVDVGSKQQEENLREKQSATIKVAYPGDFSIYYQWFTAMFWTARAAGKAWEKAGKPPDETDSEDSEDDEGNEIPDPEAKDSEDDEGNEIPDPEAKDSEDSEDDEEEATPCSDEEEDSDKEARDKSFEPFLHLKPYLDRISDKSSGVPFIGKFYKGMFEEIKKVGSGAFGTVYEVYDKFHGTKSAVKKIEARIFEYDRNKQEHVVVGNEEMIEAKKEVLSLANLLHKNIVQYKFAWIEAGYASPDPAGDRSTLRDCPKVELAARALWDGLTTTLYIQMELCKTSLADWLEARNEHLEECRKPDENIVQESLSIFKQIVEGLSFMHSKEYYHGDIKPDNVLIDFEGVAKLGDFGLTSLHNKRKSSSTCASTSGHSRGSSFEQLSSKASNYPASKNDMYCLGILLAKLLCPCRNDMTFVEEMDKFCSRNKKAALMQYPEDVRETLSALLNEDPEDIPTAKELLDNLLFREKEQANCQAAMEQREMLPALLNKDTEDIPKAMELLDNQLFREKEEGAMEQREILPALLNKDPEDIPKAKELLDNPLFREKEEGAMEQREILPALLNENPEDIPTAKERPDNPLFREKEEANCQAAMEEPKMLSALLNEDPEDIPTAKELLDNPLFREKEKANYQESMEPREILPALLNEDPEDIPKAKELLDNPLFREKEEAAMAQEHI